MQAAPQQNSTKVVVLMPKNCLNRHLSNQHETELQTMETECWKISFF